MPSLLGKTLCAHLPPAQPTQPSPPTSQAPTYPGKRLPASYLAYALPSLSYALQPPARPPPGPLLPPGRPF